MELTKKSTYGLKALFELSLAYGKSPLTTASIAKKQNIPVPFLEQIFYELKKGGILVSKRGPGGGHKLAKKPDELSVNSIIEILEGPAFFYDCLGENYNRNSCGDYQLCAARLLLEKMNIKIKESFNNITLSDMCKIYKKNKKIDFSKEKI